VPLDGRPWDDAYEQLTYERGACNLVQKYTPRLVRERVFAERNATLVIMVRVTYVVLQVTYDVIDIATMPSAACS
jgi:hypothetical protein